MLRDRKLVFNVDSTPVQIHEPTYTPNRFMFDTDELSLNHLTPTVELQNHDHTFGLC